MKRLRGQGSLDRADAIASHSRGLGSRYDVFLSCRDQDTQACFASHLYSSLSNAGIIVFQDVIEPSKENDIISIELLRSIEGSKISIIIFSRKYASFRLCLEELSKIMEVHRAYGQVVLPVFYRVDPSEVRRQKLSFGEGFNDLIQRISPTQDEVERWEIDLREAAGIAGFDMLNSKDENKDIEDIVEHVCNKLDKKCLFVMNHPVGVNSRVQEVITVLKNHQSKGVVVVGIWGTRDIGRTTMAIAIYNEIKTTFDSRCFLSNITEIWKQDDGQVSLQNRLLLEVCKVRNLTINSAEYGKIILKDRLPHKSALVVLGDVDSLDQLDTLSGSREWFGPGSRIIITTTNLDLLKDFRVDHVYSHNESVELLSWRTFIEASSKEEFIELSRSIDAYSGGLPPVLKVFLPYLFEKEVTEWKNLLKKLLRIPNDEIKKKLKVSLDNLTKEMKEIFLNIAIFFIGEDRNDVTQILNGRGFSADIGIRELVNQSLLAIDKNNKLVLHDLFWNVGRELMHDGSRKEPGKRGDKYDVFLTFRGDTRATFTSHLYSSLSNSGIVVFKDDAEVSKGSPISDELSRGIKTSEISIIIFSKEYAGSRWCLDELSKIMERHKLYGHLVLPVFYGVQPSEVRHQTSSFGQAFNDLICRISPSEDQVLKWRTALCEAGDIEVDGFVVCGSRNENEDIKNIVKTVCNFLFKKDSSVANHPIGVNPQVHDVIQISESYQSKDVIDNHPGGSGSKEIITSRNLNLLEAFNVDHANEIKLDMSPDKELSSHKFHVFLSFRGEDTGASFTAHLYSSLSKAGIVVFKDDEVSRGNHNSVELLRGIESSEISIIIFSRNYAGSRWCLEELSKIMELHRPCGQLVIPVFYGVCPAEVRHQTSSFGKAFIDLIRRISPPEDQVLKWRKALREAAAIAGFDVFNFRNESEDIKNIVEHVCCILDNKYLFVANHPVGVNSRVQDMIQISESCQSKDVILVGIWGMGGSGKTTTAKAIYNKIGHMFESRSFLSNISEVWKQENGPMHLQNQLLSEICRTNMKINGNIGSRMRNRLCHKRALVVLDDVDKLDQLNALVGSRQWFGLGSKIIITTRNKRLLHILQVDHVYLIKNLDTTESIELFSWHAFRQSSPREDFNELSRNIVDYCGGLPLALEVLGSYLFDREVKEWESVLKRLKEIPNGEIQKKLRISFDGLSNDMEKEIFLDISCFFIGRDRNDVTQILNGCGFSANIGISVLVERGLVTMDKKNKLGMHDLLRDMGREIIREKSPKDFENRSRLWYHQDAIEVLSNHTGITLVEGLALKLPRTKDVCFSTKAFKKMKRLRLLCLDNVQLEGDYEYISKNLRWLCWRGFPLEYIPANFYKKKLVAIDLKYSNLRQVWREHQLLERLKILNLSHSHYLLQTPDFSMLPNLEKLILKDCPSLFYIHPSIGYLKYLVLLNLKDCTCLRNLPRSIYKLKCLKTVILSGCSMIKKLEEDIEQMDSLTTLIADNTAITQVPFSLVRLKSIGYISLCGYEGLARDVFPSLILSWMYPLLHVPTNVDMPSSLLRDMLKSSIPNSPSSIPSNLPKQQNLVSDPGLEIQTQLNRGVTKMLESSDATNSLDILSLENFLRHLLIQIGDTHQVINTLSESISQGLTIQKNSDDCDLPADKYPYWLTFKGEGDSVKFKVPLVNGRDLKGMILCCVYLPSGASDNMAFDFFISLIIINYTKKTKLHYKQDTVTSFEEVEWKQIISNLDSDDEVDVTAIFGNRFTVKKTAVYLIYDDSFDQQIGDPPSPSRKILPYIEQMKEGSRIIMGRGERSGLNSPEWQQPTNGFLKVNVDGSCRTPNGQVSCGGVLRNGEGEFVLGFLFNAGVINSLNAEIWACILGLKVAWDSGARRIILESDSLEAIRDIPLEVTLKHPDHDLIEEFRKMLEREWEVRIQHCSSEANSAAEYMARRAKDAMPGLHICSSPPWELERIERTRVG